MSGVSLRRPGRATALATLAVLLLGAACVADTPHPERSLPAGDSGVRGTRGAVTSAEAHASRIGLDVLKRGGNAIDAAIAVGFALGVTHPSAGNIGGGGFAVVRLPDGEVIALDYRERAPGAASRDMYLDAEGEPTRSSRVGALAAGIPGNVAGFAWLHERYGTLPWRELVEPAVALARDGWALDRFHAEDLAIAVRLMTRYEFEPSARHFRRPDGSAYETGDVWRQPELADTLRRIARDGPQVFYRGEWAARLVERVRKLGGIWTSEDLAAYRPVQREPIVFDYAGHRIWSMPPPSAGGIVLRQILGASETLKLGGLEWDSAGRAHLYVEALRRAYADRSRWIGDPDFVDVPLGRLLDPVYIARRLEDVDAARATPSTEIGPGGPPLHESHETTHFSVVDASGMAVANTFTLNGMFGAKRVVPGTGVILNNEMDDFATKPGVPNMFGLVHDEYNTIAPGKRMLSSMTPTIITRDGALRAVLGSPGGPTITTTVAQIALQLIDHERTIDEAVRAPRIHHQWLPDAVIAEEANPEAVLSGLEARGHRVVRRPRLGHANCIEVDPATRGFRAVADTERDGGLAVAW